MIKAATACRGLMVVSLWGAGWALMALAPSHAAAQCETHIPPFIEITVSDAAPRFDYSLSQKKMAALAQSEQLPASDVYDLTVNAMSTGNLRIDRVIKFKGQKLPQDHVCVQVSHVLVDMHIDPVIYIASELHDVGCEFKEYYMHEMKHVEADRLLLADYKSVIARNLSFAFPTSADFNSGPLPAKDTEQTRLDLQDSVNGALEATFASMLRERSDRQKAIDSNDEFLRLTYACRPGGAGVKPELRRR